MQRVPLGKTSLQVTRLGIGLAEIGDLCTNDTEKAGNVLNAALDAGINFLDTAACYGNSEELIGRTIADRRNEYVLATKCGHITAGYSGQPWTAQTIRDSIDRSLSRMKTDHLDLVQLHSCSVEILERREAIQALQEARNAGKTRFIGYSGDNEDAAWAVNSGLFDTLQTSFNLVDQKARGGLLQTAAANGMGIIIKRPIANGVWGAKRSDRSYTDAYFRRAQEMQAKGELPGSPHDRIGLAMAFTFAHSEVDVAIVGTSNPTHMLSNIEMIESGQSLPGETLQELYRRFDDMGQNWQQLG